MNSSTIRNLSLDEILRYRYAGVPELLENPPETVRRMDEYIERITDYFDEVLEDLDRSLQGIRVTHRAMKRICALPSNRSLVPPDLRELIDLELDAEFDEIAEIREKLSVLKNLDTLDTPEF